MASPFDEPRNHQDANGKGMVQRIHLISLPQESKEHHVITRRDESESWSGGFPKSASSVTPPLISIDEVATQAINPAVDKSSLPVNFGISNDLPLDMQETWIISAVGPSNRDPELSARGLEAQSYTSHIRTLIKSSGIYVLSSLASPLISLVLAPFLTRHLSRADYGALAVLNTAIALLAGVTQLGLSSAFFRSYSYDYETQRDRLNVLSTVVVLLTLISTPTTITVIMAAPWLAEFVFKSPSLSDPVRIAALVILLQNLTVPGFAWLRAENRALFFAILSIANLLIALGVTIILVGVMQMGIVGSLIATGGGYVFILVCTLPLILLRTGLRFRFDIAWGMVTFGLPNVFNLVSVWVLQLSDRFLLARLGSLTQTASYAVAYSLGGVLSVVVLSPFQLAWPAAMFSIAKKDDAALIFQRVFRWYSIVLLFAAYALSLVGIFVLNVFFPLTYHSASPIIPIIAASIMFYGISNMLTLGVGVRRKTWLQVIFTTLSALVNVGLNLILIPLYGSTGAAVSTLVAYIVLALIGYIVNQRIYPVPFEIGQFIVALLVGSALFVGSTFLAQSKEPLSGWCISLAALGLYCGYLIFLGVFLTRSRKDDPQRMQEDFIP